MALLPSINRAIQLFEEASAIAGRVHEAISSGAADLSASDLKTAQERLAAAMEKAQAAHDTLNDAINARLGGKKGS
jgi:hypothetical protein